MTTHPELIRELKSLRKGRGVFAGRIQERVGPNLSVLCGVVGDDGPVTVREKLTARLLELAEQLPDDMCLATVAAFALSTEVRLPLYQDRVHWAAIRIDRDARTVRRRVDEAIDHLADLVAIPRRVPAEGWGTAELRVALTLDCLRPEVLEQHRIVADQDALHEVDFVSPLAVGHRYLEVDVLYGGTLHDRGIVTHDRPSFALTLPRPLSRGESHDFAVRFRLPDPRAMRSQVVHVPEHRCEQFDLRVRFGRDRTPPQVWAMRDGHQAVWSEAARDGHQHPVDRAGEVHLRFRRLVPGLAYGARWESGAH